MFFKSFRRYDRMHRGEAVKTDSTANIETKYWYRMIWMAWLQAQEFSLPHRKPLFDQWNNLLDLNNGMDQTSTACRGNLMFNKGYTKRDTSLSQHMGEASRKILGPLSSVCNKQDVSMERDLSCG